MKTLKMSIKFKLIRTFFIKSFQRKTIIVKIKVISQKWCTLKSQIHTVEVEV
jgi:hypothetical protein